jgi:Na+/H+-translocating membrane pyrophosphatase
VTNTIPTTAPLASMADAIALHGIADRHILCAIPVCDADGFVRVAIAMMDKSAATDSIAADPISFVIDNHGGIVDLAWHHDAVAAVNAALDLVGFHPIDAV